MQVHPLPAPSGHHGGMTEGSLGEFLRVCRSRLTPAAAGVVDHGSRRVPGLRREELARLAGVSVGYYTRLEQGISRSASDAVLDALARALQLSPDERAHLHSLARPAPRSRRKPRPERLRPEVRLLLETLDHVPALVLGRRTDVLGWNRMAHALLAGHLDPDAPERPEDRPNWARLLFLDPHVAALFPRWEQKARDTVADLRLIAGRYPEDAQLAELIGELSMRSQRFAELWSAHGVRGCATHTREYEHPVVGSMILTDELLRLSDEGQRLVLFAAEPDSPSAAALTLLAVGGSPVPPAAATVPARGALRVDGDSR